MGEDYFQKVLDKTYPDEIKRQFAFQFCWYFRATYLINVICWLFQAFNYYGLTGF